MLEKLQKIYPSLVLFENNKNYNYQWFITEQDNIFGIHENELNTTDLRLLETIFKKYQPLLPEKTPLEQLWHERISGTNKQPITYPFRFIYFSLQKKQMGAIEFQEALTTLFEKKIPILWENDSEGIIVEEMERMEEQIQFEQIINILIADLSVNIRFFIGSIKDDITSINENYTHLITTGKRIFEISNNNVIHFIESVPYLLLDEFPSHSKEKLSKTILQRFYNDDDMLKTIDTYFKYNLNLSESAKKLYMHRNSLQYRIDKFSKETGINIQSFYEAITVKLAIIAKYATQN